MSARSRRSGRRLVAVTVAALVPAVLLTGCAGGDGGSGPATKPPAADDRSGDSATPSVSPSPSGSASGAVRPLAGKVVVIDPGHNPGNFEHTTEINKTVDIGTNRKECDTTGTASEDGYREADFTLDVSRRLRTLLEKQGAKVELTQDDDRPFGPCVDERARFGNNADADAVISVHADGSAVGNRGFHVILPARVKEGGADTSAIVEPSRDLGEHLATAFARATGTKPANYLGDGKGLDVRDDLGGLNLSTVPKVFVECGNMRDPKDAALLSEASWRQRAAEGLAEGVGRYLEQ
ncbi:N-acetylmuramoyl-L-alanine amidase [Streptomyces sp. NPDC005805]|uniref:N-acetylmuramoyl-L-alanine amidase n=1 Tax=Streptomyces sp. NPDC005805 TaxID=3157068 RepID=UPI0033D986CB